MKGKRMVRKHLRYYLAFFFCVLILFVGAIPRFYFKSLFENEEGGSIIIQTESHGRTLSTVQLCSFDAQYVSVFDELRKLQIDGVSFYGNSYEICDNVFRLYFFDNKGKECASLVINHDRIYFNHFVFFVSSTEMMPLLNLVT